MRSTERVARTFETEERRIRGEAIEAHVDDEFNPQTDPNFNVIMRTSQSRGNLCIAKKFLPALTISPATSNFIAAFNCLLCSAPNCLSVYECPNLALFVFLVCSFISIWQLAFRPMSKVKAPVSLSRAYILGPVTSMEDQFGTTILAARFRFEVEWVSKDLGRHVSVELNVVDHLSKVTEAALVVWKQT